MKSDEEEEKKKRITPLFLALISAGGSLFIGLIIVGLLVMTGQTASSVFASPGDTPMPRISGLAMPGPEELVIKKGSSSTPNDNSQNGETPGDGSTTRDVNPSNGGTSSGGGSGGGNNADSYTDPGSNQPGNNYCPETRADNPSVWDSCHAGYVAPTIQWGGITSCTPIDKNAGTWNVTYRWNAVGGNWHGYWEGVGADGSSTIVVNVNPGEPSEEPILLGRYATLIAQDMNGWGWIIDRIYSASSPYIPMNTVCQ